MQQLGPVEGFSAAVALHHGYGHRFHPFVGGEADITVQALAAAAHTPATIGGP
jgi:hypothetical protein